MFHNVSYVAGMNTAEPGEIGARNGLILLDKIKHQGKVQLSYRLRFRGASYPCLAAEPLGLRHVESKYTDESFVGPREPRAGTALSTVEYIITP